MTEKEMFINTWDREFQTTLKIMKAYPVDKLDMKPAEKSNSARNLMWTFAREEALSGMALDGKIDFSQANSPAPATLQEIMTAYEHNHGKLLSKVKSATEADLNRNIDFLLGPGKIGPARAMDICWMMMSDSIHHRGQLSVYLRLVGAKVPSIYGPTADEPWM